MESNPGHFGCEHQPGHHEKLGKVLWVDPILLVPCELDASLHQHLDGILCIHVLTSREGEGREGWRVRGRGGRGGECAGKGREGWRVCGGGEGGVE